MSDKESRPIPEGRVAIQASIVFDEGAEIAAVKSLDDGLIYGSLPHLCKAMGLEYDTQYERIEEHSALAPGLILFPLVQGGKVIKTPCLRSNLIPYWLALVSVKRLKPDKQARIQRYQERVADVLDRLFGPGPATLPVPAESIEPAYGEGLAIARLASEQVLMELPETSWGKGLTSHVQDLESRLAALEVRFAPRETISEEQAVRISDLVKQVALALPKKMGPGNYFGTVYGQLYQRYRITSYKLLSHAQYENAVQWLEQMLREASEE